MYIEWSDQAQDELSSLLLQASKRDPLEANNIVIQIKKTEQTLLLFPRIGQHQAGSNYFEKTVPKTRILLIYKTYPNKILIFATFHTSRDPKTKPKKI